MIWFTADLHLFHENIMKYSKRPFKIVDAMHKTIIDNWNNKVEPGDSVYIVGDFAFIKSSTDDELKKILRLLKGQKFLILGNHDKGIEKFKKYFAWIGSYKEIHYENQFIVLMHYAMRVWNKSHYGAWQLYGHSHGSLSDNPNALSIDVGVDCHDFTPLSFDEIKAIMARKNWVSVDHHK